MKARLANIIGKKVIGIFQNESFEFRRYDLSVTDAEIEAIWDKFWDSAREALGMKGYGIHPIYDTPSGELEPGCLFWVDYIPENHYWDNHKGPHLFAVLPNGHRWNIDSRASNCTMPEDRLHRCWCRHGEPPNIHVDKNGLTCQAGAGSIWAGEYHGYLHNGEFVLA